MRKPLIKAVERREVFESAAGADAVDEALSLKSGSERVTEAAHGGEQGKPLRSLTAGYRAS
jgi:hypothetical protein